MAAQASSSPSSKTLSQSKFFLTGSLSSFGSLNCCALHSRGASLRPSNSSLIGHLSSHPSHPSVYYYHFSFFHSIYPSVPFLRNMKWSNAKGLVIVLVALMVLTSSSPAIVSTDSHSTLAIGRNKVLPLFHHIELRGSTCPFSSILTAGSIGLTHRFIL